MRFFSWLFGKKGEKRSRQDPDSLPPIYGGDGSTVTNAVIVNCASTDMANCLIDQFISQRHGKKGSDWNRTLEMFVDAEGLPMDTVRAVWIKTQHGQELVYYFDIGRAIRALDSLAKLARVLRSDR